MAIDKKWPIDFKYYILLWAKSEEIDSFNLFYVYCFHLEGQSGSQFPIWEVSWHEAKLNTGLRLLRHTVWIMIEIQIQIQIQKYLFRFKATGPLQAEFLN